MVLGSALDIFSRSGFAYLSRWSHVFVGITWIGLLYFFNFVQVPAYAEMEASARNNAVDMPARLPDGSEAAISVSSILVRRSPTGPDERGDR